jgi:hypothetical protein
VSLGGTVKDHMVNWATDIFNGSTGCWTFDSSLPALRAFVCWKERAHFMENECCCFIMILVLCSDFYVFIIEYYSN